jgi:hypothetical protein
LWLAINCTPTSLAEKKNIENFGEETWTDAGWEKVGVKVDPVTFNFWIRYL